MDLGPEWEKAQRGELYHAFVPELVAARACCKLAWDAYNNAPDQSRRNLVKLWKAIVNDARPMPPPAATQEEDDKLFEHEPWVMGPLRADYGINIKLGEGVMINWNSTWVDTCPINIGKRTIIGPNCTFYSGTHPLDPEIRNGLSGPEMGRDINIGEDCWFGGNVIVLPGITIAKGCTIGAGRVVTKNIPPFHVAAGNPAKVLRKIQTKLDPTSTNIDLANPHQRHVTQAPMAQE